MRLSFISIASTAIVGIQTACFAVAKPTLYVFGDSLSDIGTFKQITLGLIPPPPYWEGRWCSGPIWAEYLSLLLGYNHYNKAIGGATTDNADSTYLPSGSPIQIPSCQDQINWFKFWNPLYHLTSTRSDDIATLVIGHNDYFGTVSKLQKNSTTPEAFSTMVSDTIVDQLNQLKNIGFQNIIVSNLAAIQYTPEAAIGKTQELARVTIGLINQKVHDKATAWAKTAGLKRFYVADIAGFVAMSVKPTISNALGLIDTTHACLGGELLHFFQDNNFAQSLINFVTHLDEALMCKDPSVYYFFDPVHPAERVQRLYGYFSYKVVNAWMKGQTYELNEANLLSIIGEYKLNSPAPKPAMLYS
ncbi:hypothetical protein FBU59_000237 [Linderina macrospora]|uniref:Uncharacterized protein n=1 Tax=Linderina macrospora TaxID=4868 RepID=A0ACC1JHF8_9FUNG|nr:hypothetical protein FBU59_000237 [Linderina macrospora]